MSPTNVLSGDVFEVNERSLKCSSKAEALICVMFPDGIMLIWTSRVAISRWIYLMQLVHITATPSDEASAFLISVIPVSQKKGSQLKHRHQYEKFTDTTPEGFAFCSGRRATFTRWHHHSRMRRMTTIAPSPSSCFGMQRQEAALRKVFLPTVKRGATLRRKTVSQTRLTWEATTQKTNAEPQ